MHQPVKLMGMNCSEAVNILWWSDTREPGVLIPKYGDGGGEVVAPQTFLIGSTDFAIVP